MIKIKYSIFLEFFIFKIFFLKWELDIFECPFLILKKKFQKRFKTILSLINYYEKSYPGPFLFLSRSYFVLSRSYLSYPGPIFSACFPIFSGFFWFFLVFSGFFQKIAFFSYAVSWLNGKCVETLNGVKK